MKVKKFRNLWTMGLILFGAILIALYVAKIFFPEFIVGIAEIESVVKFGEYVDTHQWAYYLFTFCTSMFVYYFYCCACCRKKGLKFFEICLVAIVVIALFVVQKYLPQYYITLNMVSLIILPTLFCKLDKNLDIKYLYSTSLTFTGYYFAQMLSLEIRDISIMLSYPNSATYTILLIDVYICLVLFYNYFNYKERK